MKAYFLFYRIPRDEPLDLRNTDPIGGLVLEVSDFRIANRIAHMRHEVRPDERLIVCESIEKIMVLASFSLHRQWEQETAEFVADMKAARRIRH